MATSVTGLTYLQLVNRARRECGVSGADLITLASGLSYEGQRFKGWIADAWLDIQLMRSDWSWMTTSSSFPTVPGTQTYAALSDLGDWKRGSFRAYTTSVGTVDEQILPFMDWATWRNVYEYGAMRVTTGRPVAITVRPDRRLSIGPVPDNTYTVVFEYFRAPTALVNDSDDPTSAGFDLPPRFIMLLVYRAMLAYAFYESAPEVERRARTEEKRLLQQLMAYGVPTITYGPPLA